MQTHMHDTEKVIISLHLHLFVLKLDQFYQISKDKFYYSSYKHI